LTGIVRGIGVFGEGMRKEERKKEKKKEAVGRS
jgi:hypothetical protein